MNEKEEPPSNKTNLGIRARGFSTCGSLARRFKDIWSLWSSDWDIPVTRGNVSYRRHLISENL